MKIFNTIKEKANEAAIKATTATAALKDRMADTEGSVSEHAIVIIIGVVLGGILLTALIALMNGTIVPQTTSKVESMFGMG